MVTEISLAEAMVADVIGAPDPTLAENAACRGMDPDLFFPSSGRSSRPAQRVCYEACSVRLECLAYAVETGVTEGIWGGEVSVSARVREYRRLRLFQG